MRSGIIGFGLGIILMFATVFAFQLWIIKRSANDLHYSYHEYVFREKEFPWSFLDQGRVIKTALFPVRITITYYDADYNVVAQADKPGRYGAVVCIRLNGGVVQYRYITLFRTPDKVFWLGGHTTLTAQLPPNTGIDPAVLKNQQASVDQAFLGSLVGDNPVSPALAIFLAGLYETSPTDPAAVQRTDYTARDANWWYGLRKRLGQEPKYKYLIDLPPGYDAATNKRWPMILFLHGGGLQGYDPEELRITGLAKIAPKKLLPAIVLSPQLPWSQDWQPNVILNLIDEISAKYRVDPDRIYLTGLSLGGDECWALGVAYPDRFAALAPIAGEGDLADAARVKDLPIWVFQGEKDKIVNPANVAKMIDAVRKAGGHPHYTIYPGMDHSVWDATYDSPEFYTWLFAQKRGQPEVITPGLPADP